MGKGILKKVGNFIDKKSTPLLAIAGIGCFGYALYRACKDAPKAADILKKKEEAKGSKLTFKEKAKCTWKIFIPTTMAACAGVGCVVGCAVSGEKKTAAALSVAEASGSMLSAHMKATAEAVGEKKAIDILDKTAQIENKEASKNGRQSQPITKPVAPGGKVERLRCSYTGCEWDGTIDEAKHACNLICRDIADNGGAYLNQFFEYLNLDPTDAGYLLGWRRDDGMPQVLISPIIDPTTGDVIKKSIVFTVPPRHFPDDQTYY